MCTYLAVYLTPSRSRSSSTQTLPCPIDLTYPDTYPFHSCPYRIPIVNQAPVNPGNLLDEPFQPSGPKLASKSTTSTAAPADIIIPITACACDTPTVSATGPSTRTSRTSNKTQQNSPQSAVLAAWTVEETDAGSTGYGTAGMMRMTGRQGRQSSSMRFPR